MGAVFENLTEEELCDLMCGAPEDDDMQKVDEYGFDYERKKDDFNVRKLKHDNCMCSICHGLGAKFEIGYVTRDYESDKTKGRICKRLQEHYHSFWICEPCLKNFWQKAHNVIGGFKNDN